MRRGGCACAKVFSIDLPRKGSKSGGDENILVNQLSSWLEQYWGEGWPSSKFQWLARPQRAGRGCFGPGSPLSAPWDQLPSPALPTEKPNRQDAKGAGTFVLSLGLRPLHIGLGAKATIGKGCPVVTPELSRRIASFAINLRLVPSSVKEDEQGGCQESTSCP